MAPTVKNPPASSRPGFNPWVGKIPWRRAQQPTHVFLSGESPLSTEELMLLNHGVGEDPWEPLGQQVNSKGNQSWIFNVRTEAESETPYFGHLMKELTHWKRPWFWERLKAGEGDDRGWDGWMASLNPLTWVWASSGVGDGQESLACSSPWSLKGSDTTERLNWTKLKKLTSFLVFCFVCLFVLIHLLWVQHSCLNVPQKKKIQCSLLYFNFYFTMEQKGI